MPIVITVLTFVVMFILVYSVLHTFISDHHSIQMRLKAVESFSQGRSDIEEELTKPFTHRVINPLTNSVAAVLMRNTPRALRQMIENKLALAGGFGSFNTDTFFIFWGVISFILPLVTVVVTVLAEAKLNIIIGLSLMAFAVGAACPIFMLNQKIAARKKNIQRDLPDVLDILTVSVEAGLGFDGALVKLAEKMKGALVDEFTRVLQEIRMGIPRRDALRAMGNRCDVPDLSLFTTSLIQADQLGVSIGSVLRVQSASMRQSRRQRAEEKAMKAPIKMMLPLVLFIFPTIFVILLGPAIIQIIETFTPK